MPRTVMNLDDELITLAAEIYGTNTKVGTVNAALKDAVDRRRRERLMEWLADGGMEFEDHRELRDRAW
ncbi:type II toxin-antitoxin system VapB family antitoxin [Glycomyces xiaoerkulensis]|uniref:type II toxin-antitoxin system VapB family antitoxin n=1 Tax=Glycomyces xiaoerkulensis TaxID=2038139 RepID=UPI000C255CA9|nr:type II toxin-antitoxin system VapB family antitoxin [Glycomyces xiaoerkulensis]